MEWMSVYFVDTNLIKLGMKKLTDSHLKTDFLNTQIIKHLSSVSNIYNHFIFLGSRLSILPQKIRL